ncbi:C39 family peptidase [Cytobacillus sp. Hz8]|uniref:C39 family peptidase n=1 Tax=Cytobacillus sp. Hz8 TaxID=3347168 RepID=UPI0035DF95E7
MKRLSILFALFPLLGCDHFNNWNEVNTHSSTKSHFENKTQFQTKSLPIQKQNIQIIDDKNGLEKTMVQQKPEKPHKKSQILLNVPLVKQNPELKYGCEVTSLSMVLKYAGVKTNKMELYRKVKKDPDPLIRGKNGDILKWGNPADGFVGDMTGKYAGYAVFDQPIENLINQYLPGRAVNLTNKGFEEILTHVSKGFPVVVWTTGDYRLPDRWEGWKHDQQYIKTPLDLHAVALVGYDSTSVYLNDPLSGRKQVKVNKETFISSWKALKKRAVSYQ